MGPLVVFFGTFFVAKRIVEDDTQGLIWATGIFVAVTAIALAISYAIERKIHAMPLITGAVVLVMGGPDRLFQRRALHQVQAHHRQRAHGLDPPHWLGSG